MLKFISKLMSCGSCGTDAPASPAGEPHGESKEKCMACECPCDAHKDHNHDCHTCGHAHKDDGHCDCGCA